MIERKELARKETIRKFMSLKSVRTFERKRKIFPVVKRHHQLLR